MIPLLVHELRPAPAPTDVCDSLDGLPYRIFFDSSGASGKYARYSFVAADPVSVITAKGGIVEVRGAAGEPPESSAPGAPGNALLVLRAVLKGCSPASVPGLPPFQGGAAGFIGYEFGSALEGIAAGPVDDLQLPELCFGIYDCVFAWDHAEDKAWLLSRTAERQAFFLERIANAKTAPMLRIDSSGSKPDVQSSLTRMEYRAAIERIREYISAGDIFQANFAQRFRARLNVRPWDLYLTLRKENPAPFACFFEAGNVSVLSVSPERFIKVNEHRRAETRPIKGTRPRMRSPEADKASRDELTASEKDNAEHVMIVDVLRNDLSRVCRPGSVEVVTLAEPEAHPTVHHLVSTITGELSDEHDSVDLLLASIPGGSITGAPKIRAMEIIAELEPVRRDVYCGCMAYLTAGGVMDSSIVIRTFLARDGNVFFSAGGGIVADSDADLEYEETLHKAAALFSALDSVS